MTSLLLLYGRAIGYAEFLTVFFSHHIKPDYVIECDEQNLIYHAAKKGMSIGIISPFGLYRHANDSDDEGDKFYTFPILSYIGMNETHLVYRSDYNLPKYVHDFIHDTEAVFKNYAKFIARDLIIRNKRRQEK